MTSNLKTLNKVIEAMPIYGKLRETNEQLMFGQYLTVLKNWFESLRTEEANFAKELLEKAKKYCVGHPCNECLKEILE